MKKPRMTPEEKAILRRAKRAATRRGSEGPSEALRPPAPEEDGSPSVIWDYEEMIPHSMSNITPFRTLEKK